MKLRIKQIIRSVTCVYKGHKLPLEAEFSYYVRDGRRFKYKGRIFKCMRCGVIAQIFDLRMVELEDLIKTTLKDLPQDLLEDAFDEANAIYDHLMEERKCQKKKI